MYIMLNDTLKNSQYEFISKVSNLPSCRTISEYSSVGDTPPDGILYDVLKKLKRTLKEMEMNGIGMYH